jgi:hypothetical protein
LFIVVERMTGGVAVEVGVVVVDVGEEEAADDAAKAAPGVCLYGISVWTIFGCIPFCCVAGITSAMFASFALSLRLCRRYQKNRARADSASSDGIKMPIAMKVTGGPWCFSSYSKPAPPVGDCLLPPCEALGGYPPVGVLVDSAAPVCGADCEPVVLEYDEAVFVDIT